MDRRWPLVWPESTATSGGPGDAYPGSVRQANHSAATVEHLDATAFEHTPERYPAQRSQVVVAQNRDDGQTSGRQQLTGDLSLHQATVLGEVAGDNQEVGFVREDGESGDCTQVFSTTNVEVPDCRNSNPQELSGAALTSRRRELVIHENQAYPIAQKPRIPHRILDTCAGNHLGGSCRGSVSCNMRMVVGNAAGSKLWFYQAWRVQDPRRVHYRLGI
jgi:hypothetical protein